MQTLQANANVITHQDKKKKARAYARYCASNRKSETLNSLDFKPPFKKKNANNETKPPNMKD